MTLVAIATGISLLMLVIAIVGIRITARTQVGMAAVEYAILIGFAIAGVLLMLAARFILQSPFFHVQRESDGQLADRQRAGSHRR